MSIHPTTPRPRVRRVAPLAACLLAALPLGTRAEDSDATKKNRTDLEKVAVTAHLLDEATTGTKIELPVLQTAQAISVVPRELIQEQGALRIGEALRNVAGVSRSDVYGFFDGFNIRGFDASSGATYLDGLRTSDTMATSELSGLERLEVVKGPASGLYGQGPLSGLVNMVSKRPTAQRFATLDLGLGTDAYREARLDANTPLDAAGHWLGRANLVWRDQDFFVDSSGARRTYLAPSLSWKPDADTTLTLLGTWQHDRLRPWSPTVAYGSILYNPNGRIPRHRAINDRDYPATQMRDLRMGGWMFDHRFNDVFAIHQGVRYEDFHNTWDHWLFASGIRDDMRTVDRFYYGPYDEHGHNLRVDTSLSADFATGELRHLVLAGLDYGHRQSTNTNNFDFGPYPYDIYAPQYGIVPAPRVLAVTRSLTDSRQSGLYLQDHLQWGDHWTMTLGGRFDRARDGHGATQVKTSAFSPRAGVTYALSDGAALYANWSKSFNPQGNYQRFDGGNLPPERGEDIEAGIKLARPDGSLRGMFTVFQLTRQNMATEDFLHPNFYVVTGEQRSRGVEAELAWQPVEAFTFSAAYAYTQAKITHDNTLPVGARLAGIPRHNLNLWGRYTVQGGVLAGFGAGLGLNYQSERLASNYEPLDPVYGRPFVMKAYVLVDAALYYDDGPWSVRLNLKNAFDRRYFVTTSSSRTNWGTPRSLMLNLERRF
ncbi:MAG: Ferrichrome outer membrane transporter/phage receptor [Luteibacter sp.]|uniref:TonB-dependent siderophore receptor n=1 Tax=Luteibacter sp. TaxID=1886636 RepID=UPI0013863015|nr:TonB-dependent siderophore receptor [Luteibacter sp.]KAF1003663.1 MAG: Ferrichrome outer membrane transporter/phage receptor [Luteibacter sp.]